MKLQNIKFLLLSPSRCSRPAILRPLSFFDRVPSESRFSNVELRSDDMVICSVFKIRSPEKHGWCKIKRNSDLCSVIMQNMSSNEILVDETVILSGDTAVIKCGSEIIPFPGPVGEGYLSYVFKVMPTQECCKKELKISVDVEHAKCSICLNTWHDVVTVAPCLHNFCNGCFSEWLRRSQKKHASVLCPQCRSVVQFVGRNHFLHNIEEDILLTDSSLRRCKEELALLDSYSLIKSPLVINNGKNTRRKRARLLPDEQSDGMQHSCPQCETEHAGFQCDLNTIHLQCQACGGMMPSRDDITTPQHCLGCDRAFCGAYWEAQGVIGSSAHPICCQLSFKAISARTITRIPFLTHEKNRHEQDITVRSVLQMGKPLQDVISDWVIKLNNRQIDRSRLPLNHAEMITAGTHVCNECYDKLVAFLLYWFRISLPRYRLPQDASQREDCWYGYACRTQHHNEEHAWKLNHVCRPLRDTS